MPYRDSSCCLSCVFSLITFPLREGAVDRHQQFRVYQRLGEQVEGARTHRFNAGVHRGVARHQHDSDPRERFGHVREKIETVPVRESDIADDQVERLLSDALNCLRASGRLMDLESLVAQPISH